MNTWTIGKSISVGAGILCSLLIALGIIILQNLNGIRVDAVSLYLDSMSGLITRVNHTTAVVIAATLLALALGAAIGFVIIRGTNKVLANISDQLSSQAASIAHMASS